MTHDEIPDRLSPADAELLTHDARKPAHVIATCTIPACWVCHRNGVRRCSWCADPEVTEGGLCVRCAKARFGEAS